MSRMDVAPDPSSRLSGDGARVQDNGDDERNEANRPCTELEWRALHEAGDQQRGRGQERP
jgi:hypothetical protein